MKKVKSFIAALVVLSVVGSALAFKTSGNQLYTCDPGTGLCDIKDSRNFVIDNQHGTIFTQSALFKFRFI